MTILVGIITFAPLLALLGTFIYNDYAEYKERKEYEEWRDNLHHQKRVERLFLFLLYELVSHN